MKATKPLLPKEEPGSASCFEPEFLSALDAAEAERIRSEAMETAELERRQASDHAELPDLFGGDPRVWNFTPTRIAKAKKVDARDNPLSELQAALELQLKQTIKKRQYTKEKRAPRATWNVLMQDEPNVVVLFHLLFSLRQVDELAVGTKAYYSLWLWFRIPNRGSPFSFLASCAVIGMDPETLLERLAQIRRSLLTDAQWLETERTLLQLQLAEALVTAESLEEWRHVGALRDQLEDLAVSSH